ncbi:putative RDD family membrane protein YckC [Paenibacillus phyllosphaerae]|uniref:Putative RDD family membrane protein YckC n=1 Tax=Paenibacillus phyllosphaerae TaxID=274593 RepID=A0A7W5B1F5_9BACL|nr:putative RDD family membrane protein YckC [Paenibacillus phyllosphaerae]
MEERQRASIGRRIGAFLVDHVTITAVAGGMMMVVVGMETWLRMLTSGMGFVILTGYILYLCKDVIGGRSIGKRLFGLIVRNEQGETPTVVRRIIRNAFVFIWPIEFILIVGSKRRLKIGDRIAHTDVYVMSGRRNVVGIVVAAVIATAIGITLLVGGVLYLIKNDASYETATAYIENSADIREAAGEEIEFGFLPSGSVRITNGAGEADYAIKVKGSKREITVFLTMSKKPGDTWIVEKMSYR